MNVMVGSQIVLLASTTGIGLQKKEGEMALN